MKKKALLYILFYGLLSSCSSRFIQQVNPDTKIKFGFEINGPNKAIYFVENATREVDDTTLKNHTDMANTLYNKYGPATDQLYVGATNAKDFKFNLKGKTYYIAVENLPQRTAMILFNGKSKPIIELRSAKYHQKIKRSLK